MRAQGQAVREGDAITRLAGAFQDITARRLVDDALAEERRFLETVLDSLPNAAVFVFGAGADAIVERMHGSPTLTRVNLPASRIVGRPLAELATASDRTRVDAAVNECLTGKRSTVEILRDGRRLELHFVPPDAASGGRRGLAVAYDVTERDLVRTRLAVQERLITIGTLAAGVGHEINNPLSYLMTNIALVSEELRAIAGGSPSARFRELFGMLDETHEGAERIRRIVRSLRSFAREEETLSAVDVNGAVEAAIRMAMHEMRPRATLLQKLTPVPDALGDEARLGQILVNLLVNAGQAFGARPKDENHITVSTTMDTRGRIVIEVCDNGPGMDAATAARIFDRSTPPSRSAREPASASPSATARSRRSAASSCARRPLAQERRFASP